MNVKRAKGIGALRAAEWCAGEGPAAIALKRIGVGTVDASDNNPEALHALSQNAILNGVRLDKIEIENLENILFQARRRPVYDLIAVNPPCRPEMLLPKETSRSLINAIDGGGEEFTILISPFERLRST